MLLETRPFDGVRELLVEVAKRGLTVMLASSGAPDQVEAYLACSTAGRWPRRGPPARTSTAPHRSPTCYRRPSPRSVAPLRSWSVTRCGTSPRRAPPRYPDTGSVPAASRSTSCATRAPARSTTPSPRCTARVEFRAAPRLNRRAVTRTMGVEQQVPACRSYHPPTASGHGSRPPRAGADGDDLTGELQREQVKSGTRPCVSRADLVRKLRRTRDRTARAAAQGAGMDLARGEGAVEREGGQRRRGGHVTTCPKIRVHTPTPVKTVRGPPVRGGASQSPGRSRSAPRPGPPPRAPQRTAGHRRAVGRRPAPPDRSGRSTSPR